MWCDAETDHRPHCPPLSMRPEAPGWKRSNFGGVVIFCRILEKGNYLDSNIPAVWGWKSTDVVSVANVRDISPNVSILICISIQTVWD